MKRFSSNSATPALVLILCSLLVLLGGCMNSENDDLLNAPLAEESIRVRLLNLAGDGAARELQLEGSRRTAEVPFASLSAPVSSPADSAQAATVRNGTQEYTTPYKTRFSRNALFTFIALPSADGTTAVDTMLVLSAPDSISPRTNNVSYLRFINGFPGENSFSLRLGCPNGTSLAAQVPFLGLGGKIEMAAGTYTISLLKRVGTGDSVVGYYSAMIGPNSDYSIILYPMGVQKPELLLLHDRGLDNTALQQLPAVSASEAEIRVLNFSSQSVDISKVIADQPDELVAGGIASRSASAFATVSACTSANEDTLKVGGTPHFVGVSLEVLKQYLVLTIDSGTTEKANFSMAVPPSTAASSADSATIRVANLAWDFPALEISLGARTTVTNTYVTGKVLAPALEFGYISEPVSCLPGPAPFVVFSNGPKQLRAAAYAEAINPGGRYLLIITRNGDKLELTLFDENNPSSRPLDVLVEGIFTQIVNAVPDADTVQFSLGSVISNRSLFYGSASATVLPPGSHVVSVGGRQENITLENGKRTLILISGSAASPDITTFTTPPMGALPSDVRRRFVNASTSITALTVKLDYDGGSIFADQLAYTAMSPVDIASQARKITLVFLDATPDGEKTVLERNNIPFSLGQNFTIVFAGNSPSTYRAILLQEF